MRHRTVSRLFLAAAALLGVLVLFGTTDLDLVIQDQLFDASAGAWIVDARAPVPRLVFYRLPKLLLAAFGVSLLGWSQLARLPRWRGPHPPWSSREVAFVFTAMVVVPLSVGIGKYVSNVHCPCDLERYGGQVPHHRLLEARPSDAPRGRCFPAAHASGGFSLFAFALVGRRRAKDLSWGLVLGGIMGAYQMARGAHFLSHTLVSMLLAWCLVLVLARAFGLDVVETSGQHRELEHPSGA